MLFDRCAGALGPAETGGLSAKDDCRNALSLRRYVAFAQEFSSCVLLAKIGTECPCPGEINVRESARGDRELHVQHEADASRY